MNKLSAFFLVCLLAFFGIACADNEVYEEQEEIAGVETDTTEATYGTDMTDPVGTSAYYDTWDLDRNAELSEDEFGEGFASTSYYGNWDADDDDLLDTNEFSSGLYGLWDRDASGELEESEWNEQGPMWYGDTWDTSGFAEWDADASGSISAAEFNERIGGEQSFFHNWDLDGDGLTLEEYHRGLFGLWDRDGNGLLTREEFEAGHSAYENGTAMM